MCREVSTLPVLHSHSSLAYPFQPPRDCCARRMSLDTVRYPACAVHSHTAAGSAETDRINLRSDRLRRRVAAAVITDSGHRGPWLQRHAMHPVSRDNQRWAIVCILSQARHHVGFAKTICRDLFFEVTSVSKLKKVISADKLEK